jgi:hypothetical protein
MMFVTNTPGQPAAASHDRSYFSVALFAAQRFLIAAMIAALPAALSFRFGFAGAAGSD